MQFGLSLPIHASYADPQLHIDLAIAAEGAGWDGYFVWDHIAWKHGATHVAVTDPWITLAAIAARTERIRLGPLMTPLTRRRPWKVARETIALDHLSKGRLILGVGLGAVAKTEFNAFGEEGDDKVRGRMLDDALAVLTGLWRGELFTHTSEFYQIAETKFTPVAIQSPRIPIWVAGSWRGGQARKPFRRAARFEGTFPFIPNRDGSQAKPEEYAAIRDYVLRHRTSTAPFDIVCRRPMSAAGLGTVAERKEFADAGVTWWMLSDTPGKYSLGELRRLITSGPYALVTGT
jgi:alkanesulfonate monooxygenase SsuD/methylene tetrahydromethanopterin reductase-like flavin-dependent oxidoreductase (luciferase family)